MNGMLERLYRSKAAESAADASIQSYEDVERLARERRSERRSFRGAIERAQGAAIVAEVKHASPSAGVIVRDFDAVRIAQFYEEARADAISVLTEFAHFKGRLAHLDLVRTCTTRPILRKDFLSTPYEIAQSAAHGADAVLLIVAGLNDAQLSSCLAEAAKFDLDALVEIHTEDELDRAVESGATLLGINNRNLQTFETDVGVSERLLPLIPQGCPVICESGIRGPEDVERLAPLGARGFLVGEMLLRRPDPHHAIGELRNAAMARPA
jgi:indole-3-glycerol phosphate synthase